MWKSALRCACLALAAVAGCGVPAPAGMPDAAPGPAGLYPSAPAETQRKGDPAKGRAALLNNGYVSCGFPYQTLWPLVSQAMPIAPDELLPERTGHNATLPYFFTASTPASGVEIVAPNCLTCHAGRINGQVVIGLGNAAADFSTDRDAQDAHLAAGFLKDPKEQAEMKRWLDRLDVIGPYTTTLTRGVNPADNLTAVLFAHHDPKTLAWTPDPALPLPTAVFPVDVPPWWRMARKTAMFYSAEGRGDHARFMMLASTLCTDSVAEAEAIDAYFGDVEAYIASIQPPKWPFPVDAALAKQGEAVYAASCARCHGTPLTAPSPSYPNYIVPAVEVGTDDTLAAGGAQFGGPYLDWFKASYYGQGAHAETQNGYVAPPLDGIWATAPFLHNGSVPTLAALLDSKTRPKYWTRSFDSMDYDPQAVGWKFTALDHGQTPDLPSSMRTLIYDTAQPGYGNGGHPYGDALSDGDRGALIEYLKTL